MWRTLFCNQIKIIPNLISYSATILALTSIMVLNILTFNEYLKCILVLNVKYRKFRKF